MRTIDETVWGSVDIGMIARFLTDKATPLERATVDRQLAERPQLRQAIDLVHEVLRERESVRQEKQQLLGSLVLALSFAAARRLKVQVRQAPSWVGELGSVSSAPSSLRGETESEQSLIEFEHLVLMLTPSAGHLGIQVFSEVQPVEGLNVEAVDESGRTLDSQPTDAEGYATLSVPGEGSYRLVIRWPSVPEEG